VEDLRSLFSEGPGKLKLILLGLKLLEVDGLEGTMGRVAKGKDEVKAQVREGLPSRVRLSENSFG
jgi:hypothetical protein